MVRNYQTLTCLMIALLALAGTASAAASLTGDVSSSVESEHASTDVDGALDANADDGLPTYAGYGNVGANVRGHDVGTSVDSDGNVGANVDDHSASASADVDARSATVTVDGHTVSTNDLPNELPTADLPDTPHGSASISAAFSVVASAIGGIVASLAGNVSGMFNW